jgi:hypothetical protein
MVTAARTVVVPMPIAVVFAFLADGMNEQAWRPSVTAVRPPSESGIGAVWAQTMRGPGGIRVRGDYVVTEQEEPVLFGFRVVAGPVRPTGRFDLVALAPTATQVRFSLAVAVRGPMRLLSRPIATQVRAEVDAILNVPAAMGC